MVVNGRKLLIQYDLVLLLLLELLFHSRLLPGQHKMYGEHNTTQVLGDEVRLKESFRVKEGLKWTALDEAAERVRHNWISRSLPSSEVV